MTYYVQICKMDSLLYRRHFSTKNQAATRSGQVRSGQVRYTHKESHGHDRARTQVMRGSMTYHEPIQSMVFKSLIFGRKKQFQNHI